MLLGTSRHPVRLLARAYSADVIVEEADPWVAPRAFDEWAIRRGKALF